MQKKNPKTKVSEKAQKLSLVKERENENKNIIIFDNIKNAQEWKSSSLIREKNNEF